jgi:RyR domain
MADDFTQHKVDRIAEATHEVNRAYCQALGDTSQAPWSKAPEWQRSSARLGVRLHLGNPASTPQDSHESWMKEKLAAGWVYGAEKNPDAKPPTHPCLVPFDQLPVHQKAKDYIFRAVVKAME